MRKVARLTVGGFCVITLFALQALADIPPGDGPRSSGETDWSYIIGGILSAFAGALFFVWIGRRISKKKQL